MIRQVSLPLPPSTNNLYFNRKRGRTKTAEYEAWILKASEVLRDVQPFPEGAYPVSIKIHIVMGDKFNINRDGDNFLKPIFDAIKKNGIIKNDNLRHVASGGFSSVKTVGESFVIVTMEKIV